MMFDDEDVGLFIEMIKMGADRRPEVSRTGEYRGIRYMITNRGWFCAYIEVPEDTSDESIECHGGLTYGYDCVEHMYPCNTVCADGFRVVGWDYAHLGDERTTEEDVMRDIRQTIDDYLGGTS